MTPFEVVRSERAGLSVFCAPDSRPVPSAGLTFRAGRADETAATSGLSHLAEHLVLPARTGERVDFNGHIEALGTALYASGPPHDLRAFLEATAGLVSRPPLERFEVERKILLAEEEQRGIGAVRHALALRFGPVGAGLTGYREYGVRKLGPADVEVWLATRFTGENAVLWVAGMDADGLELDLPRGERVPCPDPRQIADLRTPTVYDDFSGGFCLSFLAPRGVLTSLTQDYLADALLDRLRYELGLTYSVDTELYALGTTLGHVTFSIDVADSTVPALLTEALHVVETLAAGGVDEARLERLKETRRRYDDDPSGASGWVSSCADWELQGLPFQSHAEYAQERDAATTEEVAARVAELLSTLLVVGPETTPIPEGFEPYPLSSTRRVSGRRHTHRRLRDRLRRDLRRYELHSSPEGITAAVAGGSFATALYDETVVCLHEPGERTLLSEDGFFVTVVADVWAGGEELVAEIDAAIPPERVVVEDPVAEAARKNVADLANATFRRTGLVSQELRLLASLLEEGEQLLVLAKATRGWRLGLLALTDERLRFLYGDGDSHSFVIERGTDAQPHARGKKLELDVDGERVRLTEVEPDGKAEEIEQALRGLPFVRKV